MGKAPAFQTYAADFFMDTNEWEVDELGIYWRLLLSEWVNGSIPNDEKRLARIAGCGTKKFQKGWGIIKIKFYLDGDGRLQNRKMEEVRQIQANYSKLQSEKGKRSAEVRYNRGSTVVQPKGQPKPNSSSSSSSSSSTSKEDNNIKSILLEHRKTYSEAYPAIDLEIEASKAQAWLESNPKNKKSNLKRFLNNWFMKAQDRKNIYPPKEDKFI